VKETIDLPAHPSEDFEYLRKSAIIFKIYAGLVISSVLVILCWFAGLMMFSMQENLQVSGFFIFLWAVLILAFTVAGPIGVVFVLKAYKRKEASSGFRLIHLLGHLVFCFILFTILIVFVRDVSPLFLGL
jgi:hypothetical protein